MPYFVTFAKSGAPPPDLGSDKPLELVDALTRAYQMLDAGVQEVAVRDDKGNSISGEDLRACWRGDKEITPDLKSVKSAADDRGD
jgi:hypothetical protein